MTTPPIEILIKELYKQDFDSLQDILGYDDTRMLRFLKISLREAHPCNEANIIRIMADVLGQQLRRGGQISNPIERRSI
ncbi:MAG: hypothetical protein Q8M92_01150 [Candidatus Subteraquimicrobiales bacterium]|nr:hypothetical protein [Candidatus Subteraquimicrobiales bacterium]